MLTIIRNLMNWKTLLAAFVLMGGFTRVSPAIAGPADPGSAAFPGVTAEMTAEWWQWAVSIWQFSDPSAPPDETKIHPLRTEAGTEPGDVDPSSVDCMVGQHGPLWFLGGSFIQVDLFPDGPTAASVRSPSLLESDLPDITRECEIPLGKTILMPVINGACDTAGEIHLGNLTGDETLQETIDFLQSCATELGDAIDSETVEASFGPAEGSRKTLNVRRVRTQQPFSYSYPPDHILQYGGETWEPAVNPSLAFADGYWVLVKPLRPGKYELNTFGDAPEFEFSLRIKYILTIVGAEEQ